MYAFRSGMSFEDAIRQFLESFKLPGEAQKIIRILEAWSRQFYAQEPGFFTSADAVYILAISVIMLNTDKHNPAVSIHLSAVPFHIQCGEGAAQFTYRSREHHMLHCESGAELRVDLLETRC